MRQFDTGVKRAVTHLRFRPDGAAVTAAFRRSAALATITLTSGVIARTAPFPVTEVTCFAYSPDGSLLAVGGADGVARPYEWPSMRCLAELRVGESTAGVQRQPVHSLAFSPGASPWLAAAGAELWLWERTRQQYLCLPEAAIYTGVGFTPDGSTVVANEAANALVGWSIKPLGERFRVPIAKAVLTQFALSPDGETVAVQTLSVIDLKALDGRHLRRLGVPSSPADLAFTPDGRSLVVAAGPRTLVCDVASGEVGREYDWGVGPVAAVAVSPDGTMAACGGEKGRVVVWDLDG